MALALGTKLLLSQGANEGRSKEDYRSHKVHPSHTLLLPFLCMLEPQSSSLYIRNSVPFLQILREIRVQTRESPSCIQKMGGTPGSEAEGNSRKGLGSRQMPGWQPGSNCGQTLASNT